MVHYGLIVNFAVVTPLLHGWPALVGTGYAPNDVNIDNFRGFDFWDKMAKAYTMTALLDVTKVIGSPWTSTVAIDKFCEALNPQH